MKAESLTPKWFAVILLAVPILIQVYFNSSLTYLLMRKLKVPHNETSPGALIGASNFFELAVAVAITLFGPSSGAALACVVGGARGSAGNVVRVQGLQKFADVEWPERGDKLRVGSVFGTPTEQKKVKSWRPWLRPKRNTT